MIRSPAPAIASSRANCSARVVAILASPSPLAILAIMPITAPLSSESGACFFAGFGGCATVGFLDGHVATVNVKLGVGLGGGAFATSLSTSRPYRVSPSSSQ